MTSTTSKDRTSVKQVQSEELRGRSHKGFEVARARNAVVVTQGASRTAETRFGHEMASCAVANGKWKQRRCCPELAGAAATSVASVQRVGSANPAPFRSGATTSGRVGECKTQDRLRLSPEFQSLSVIS